MIVRYLQYAGMVIIFALSKICLAQVAVNGDVEGRWTIENSPYIVTGDLTVRNDDELIIDPGVEVRFRRAGIPVLLVSNFVGMIKL